MKNHESTVDTYSTMMPGNYLVPLVTAIWHLGEHQRQGTNYKQNEVETDWCLSSILMATTLFESWTAWLRYNRRDHVPSTSKSIDGFYTELRQRYPDRLPCLQEVFRLRNAIAHNHVWEVTFDWGANTIVDLQPIDTDKRYENADVWPDGRFRGGMHFVATLIDRQDVKTVLSRICDSLSAMTDIELPANDRGVRERLFPSAHLQRTTPWPNSLERISILELPTKIV